MPLPREERTIELPLHDEVLTDLVTSHLYAIGVLKDVEDVIKIKFGEPNSKGIRKLNFTFIEEREAEVIVHK